jgi:predicted AlkP superfamily phosphohydrolase/phosphomutase
MADSGRRLLIIGLDGATFDLIEPWAEAGDLPNLARLMEWGCWGRLRSTTPAMTFPAWSTMMTGVNPGRHGIFDFTRRRHGGYRVEFVNATHRRSPTIWRMLSDVGCRVGVLGLPTTYPPEPVNGFLIAGFDAPVSTGIDASFVYPPQLYPQIRREAGEYRITDFQELNIGPNWHADALSSLQSALRDRTAIAEYLLRKERWDCFMVLFGESDTVGHHFWAFHDRASPRHVARGGKLGGAIRIIYSQLDDAIGQLMAAAPGATVMVLSDHGFGGAGDRILYLNRWLAQQGYLRFKTQPGPASQAVQWGKRWGLRWLPPVVPEQVLRRGGGALANRVESSTRFGGIDWSQSCAYSEESNTCPAVWFNLSGREPDGLVPPDAYETLRNEIIARLEDWRNPVTGQQIVARAWRREELYHGPQLEDAPDIVLELALDEGYTYTCLSSRGQPGPVVRRLSPAEHLGAKGQSMNGSHRPDGILIMAGPDIQTGQRIDGAGLIDIAPTILALLNQPSPVKMDGRVLSEAFRIALPQPVSIPELDWQPELAESYTASESQQLAARLRSLGYLE